MIGIQPETVTLENQIRTLHAEGLNDVAIGRKPDARITGSKKTSKQPVRPVRQTHRPTAVPELVEEKAVEELRHRRLGLLHAAAQRGMEKAQTEGWKSPWKISPPTGKRSVNRDEQMRALWKLLPANQQK